jgi:hypothetical protein
VHRLVDPDRGARAHLGRPGLRHGGPRDRGRSVGRRRQHDGDAAARELHREVLRERFAAIGRQHERDLLLRERAVGERRPREAHDGEENEARHTFTVEAGPPRVALDAGHPALAQAGAIARGSLRRGVA